MRTREVSTEFRIIIYSLKGYEVYTSLYTHQLMDKISIKCNNMKRTTCILAPRNMNIFLGKFISTSIHGFEC